MKLLRWAIVFGCAMLVYSTWNTQETMAWLVALCGWLFYVMEANEEIQHL